MAGKIGLIITPQTIQRYEMQGIVPNFNTLVSLAEALGVKIEDLTDAEG